MPTPRTKVKRHPERGEYDRATIDAILDEALICHVGFVVDDQPYVIPTIHARNGETLYLHGSPASRMLRNLAKGIDLCRRLRSQTRGSMLRRPPTRDHMDARPARESARASLARVTAKRRIRHASARLDAPMHGPYAETSDGLRLSHLGLALRAVRGLRLS
jgi:hypothetical protein